MYRGIQHCRKPRNEIPYCTNRNGQLHLARRKFLSTQEMSEGEGGGLSIGETTRGSFSVETFDSVGKRTKMQRSSSRTLIPIHPRPLPPPPPLLFHPSHLPRYIYLPCSLSLSLSLSLLLFLSFSHCLAMWWKVFIVTLLPAPTLRPFFVKNALHRRRR